MQQDEIVRRNTAIATYMKMPFENGVWFDPLNGFPYLTVELEFHRKWAWIMPAAEKIVKEWDPNKMIGRLHGDKLDFVSTFWNSIWSIERVNSKSMIEAIWLAVSDYCLAQQEGK